MKYIGINKIVNPAKTRYNYFEAYFSSKVLATIGARVKEILRKRVFKYLSPSKYLTMNIIVVTAKFPIIQYRIKIVSFKMCYPSVNISFNY